MGAVDVAEDQCDHGDADAPNETPAARPSIAGCMQRSYDQRQDKVRYADIISEINPRKHRRPRYSASKARPGFAIRRPGRWCEEREEHKPMIRGLVVPFRPEAETL